MIKSILSYFSRKSNKDIDTELKNACNFCTSILATLSVLEEQNNSIITETENLSQKLATQDFLISLLYLSRKSILEPREENGRSKDQLIYVDGLNQGKKVSLGNAFEECLKRLIDISINNRIPLDLINDVLEGGECFRELDEKSNNK